MTLPAHTRKVAALLMEMARTQGKPTSRGVAVQLDVTRQDVASLLGLSRIEATLAVNALKLAGALAFEGSTLLLNPGVLQRFAEGEAQEAR